jgi:hypothetical protein
MNDLRVERFQPDGHHPSGVAAELSSALQSAEKPLSPGELSRQLGRPLRAVATALSDACRAEMSTALRVACSGPGRASSSPLAAVLGELREDKAATLETIRRLSRGLYPPFLESQGLAAALTAHARRTPIPVQVRACDRRFSPRRGDRDLLLLRGSSPKRGQALRVPARRGPQSRWSMDSCASKSATTGVASTLALPVEAQVYRTFATELTRLRGRSNFRPDRGGTCIAGCGPIQVC